MANAGQGDESDDKYKTPSYILIGQIHCPVTGEVIHEYFEADDDKLPSYYRSHFIENKILGSGGYAVVAECKNRFDQRLYAIKKMGIGHDLYGSKESLGSGSGEAADSLGSGSGEVDSEASKESSFASMIREVLIWSDLTHKNIVRYYESWIENKFSGEIGDTWDSESLGKIVRNKPCLYVQLELCDSSLRTKMKLGSDCMSNWISIEECQKTFKAIVNGLAYIHGKGVMHGDLSVDNILYHDGVGKITDFGLARMIGSSVDALATRTL